MSLEKESKIASQSSTAHQLSTRILSSKSNSKCRRLSCVPFTSSFVTELVFESLCNPTAKSRSENHRSLSGLCISMRAIRSSRSPSSRCIRTSFFLLYDMATSVWLPLVAENHVYCSLRMIWLRLSICRPPFTRNSFRYAESFTPMSTRESLRALIIKSQFTVAVICYRCASRHSLNVPLRLSATSQFLDPFSEHRISVSESLTWHTLYGDSWLL